MDFALVSFDGVNTAANRFAAARDRSGPASRWSEQVGLVEHHKDDHLVLRGMFAGQYLDADEALHASEPGARAGWATGALIGLLLAPPGFAVGSVLGATVGSQAGYPTEIDPEPKALVDRLRAAIPVGGSAVVLVGDADTVDEMLTSLEVDDAQVTRRALSDDELAAVNA